MEIFDNIMKIVPVSTGDEAEFYRRVSDLLSEARSFAKRQLDSTLVTAYYEIGRMIVEREQQGQKRAQYGSNLIKGLSAYLTEKYGKGFSVVNLQNISKDYQTYAPSIQQTLSAEFETNKSLTSIFNAPPQKGKTRLALSRDLKTERLPCRAPVGVPSSGGCRAMFWGRGRLARETQPCPPRERDAHGPISREATKKYFIVQNEGKREVFRKFDHCNLQRPFYQTYPSSIRQALFAEFTERTMTN